MAPDSGPGLSGAGDVMEPVEMEKPPGSLASWADGLKRGLVGLDIAVERVSELFGQDGMLPDPSAENMVMAVLVGGLVLVLWVRQRRMLAAGTV